jgi:branched-subunit amino acid aminotransferase/4-amino-4-deoxychorismate lyase
MINASGDFSPWLGVFETLRVIDGVPLFVPEHRAELARAMEVLGLKTQADFAQAQGGLPALSGRWRWIVTPDETFTFFTGEPTSAAEPVAISVSPVRVGSQNWDARFKTLSYLSHIQAGKTVATPDAILLNENGHVASASRGNIFWRRGEQLYTPAHEAGCRCGVVRSFVLSRRKVEEGHFPLGELLEADEIFLTNSIKGIVSVNEVQGRSMEAFPSADTLRDEYAQAVAAQLKP